MSSLNILGNANELTLRSAQTHTPESTTGFQPWVDTHRSTTTYQPTSTLLPFGQLNSEDKKKLVIEELKGLWTFEPIVDSGSGSTFWNTFFSEGRGQECLDKLRQDGYYGADVHAERDQAGIVPERWKIPKVPPATGETLDETAIVEAFLDIFNHVILTLGMAESRVAVDGQRVQVTTRDGSYLMADVFLWGKGSSAFPHIDGKPKQNPDPKAAKNSPNFQPHKKLLQNHQTPQHSPPKTSRKATHASPLPPDSQSPAIDWTWCCVPIEVKTSVKRGTGNNPRAFRQSGTYVREVLAAQPNRRFVPSLVFTEQTVEFLHWDRAGVAVSHPIDYHARPLDFCNMMASLVMWDDQKLGFDPTVFYCDRQLHIRTKELVEGSIEDVEYVVEDTLFRSYTLRGRGSTCWRARRPTKKGARYIIQDSWVEGGMGAERDILTKIETARKEGEIAGAAPFIHIEDVQLPGAYTHPDTTRYNRQYDQVAGNIELVHTRTVLSCWPESRPLETFATSEELVDTLHDVIITHGEIYEKAGVLHRDIVPWNILIQPDAPEGQRGILIDFSSAVPTNTISKRLHTTPGSHLFRCCNSLKQGPSNTHMDDLESFYWILCFIVAHHAYPDLATSRFEVTPAEMLAWTEKVEGAAAIAKRGHLTNDFKLKVSSGFSPAVRRFTTSFHGFFTRRKREHSKGKLRIPPNPTVDYEELTEGFARAIGIEGPSKRCTNESRKQGSSGAGRRRTLGDFDPKAPTSASKRLCLCMGIPLPGGDIAKLGDIIEPIDVGSALDSDSEPDSDSTLSHDSALVDSFMEWSVQLEG